MTTRTPKRPAAAATCQCRQRILGQLHTGGQPVTIATFHNQQLIAIQRRHWAGRDGCRLPTEHINPDEYARSR